MAKRYDAIIIGARCAGAATGMLLARQGLKVLIVDHDQLGADTMSTHALLRAGVMQLHRWGVLEAVKTSGAQPVRETSFIYGPERMRVEIKPTPQAEALYAPRRYALDAILARAAVAAGAELRYGVGCQGLVTDANGRVTGVRLRNAKGADETLPTSLVIGADGRRSSVARLAGARTIKESRHASAVLYAYVEGAANQGYRWYWDKGAAGGLIPTNDRQSCAFVALPSARAHELRRKDPSDLAALARALLPQMAIELDETRPVSPLTLYAGQIGRVREPTGPGWALVGDAGYFKDPISAHGISDALRDAEILARAIVAGRLEDYPPLRKALSGAFFEITDQMASFAWSLGEIAALHRTLHAEMKPEQAWLASLDGPNMRAGALPPTHAWAHYERTSRPSRALEASAQSRELKMTKSMYEKYGGFSQISKIVMDLYDRLLDDDEVGPFFDNVDMTRIIDHQTKFVSSLLGGPASYTDDQIQKLHAHLAIGPTHFDTLRRLLGETLADHNFAPDDIDTVVSEFDKRRHRVVK